MPPRATPSAQQPPSNFPQFQLFAGSTAACPCNAVAVTQAEVKALLPAAIDAWQAVGLDDADVRKLENVTIQIGNLGTSILGLEAAGVIMINQTAAGYNWYVGTGRSSSQVFGLVGPGGEFVAGPGSPAADDVDLLTVLEHELGHVIGLTDNDQTGRRDGRSLWGLAFAGRRRPTILAAIEPRLEAPGGQISSASSKRPRSDGNRCGPRDLSRRFRRSRKRRSTRPSRRSIARPHVMMIPMLWS